MSLKMPVLESESKELGFKKRIQGTKVKMKEELQKEDQELVEYLSNQEPETDWQSDFLRVIATPNQENVLEEEFKANEHHENHVELNSKVIEEHEVLVSQDFKSSGQVSVVLNDTWSLQPLNPGLSYPYEVTISNQSPPLQSASLYHVEGKDDPEDEGICIVSPTPPTASPSATEPVLYRPSSPFTSTPIVEVIDSDYYTPVIITDTITETPPSPASPEKVFFDKHNIMKWVIDDQDISDLPELSHQAINPVKIEKTSTSPKIVSSTATSSTPSLQYVVVEPKSEIASYLETFQPEKDQDQDQTRHDDDETDSTWTPNAPIKRKRGRPTNNSPREITMKLPRMRRKSSTTTCTSESDLASSYLSDSASGLTDDEVSALKYRRMRDLNNVASKRCRENRKNKISNAETELKLLIDKNSHLHETVNLLEAKVTKLKTLFLNSMSNPGREIANARIRRMGQTLSISPEFVGSFMSSSSNVMPDVNSFWST